MLSYEFVNIEFSNNIQNPPSEMLNAMILVSVKMRDIVAHKDVSGLPFEWYSESKNGTNQFLELSKLVYQSEERYPITSPCLCILEINKNLSKVAHT